MSEQMTNTDWRNRRLGRFTASAIHKLFESGRTKELFGKGAMTYIHERVAEEITQIAPDQVETKAIEHGYGYELEASQLFEERRGLKGILYGIGNPQFFEYGDHAGGSPDWEIENTCGADFKCPYNSAIHIANLRIKTVEEFKKQRYDYYCQLQMNMLIRNWKEAFFVSYDPRMPNDLKLYVLKILPDDEWVKEFKHRLDEAIILKERILDELAEPLLILASYDPQTNTIIASKENI